jgi:hypothetical protein
MTRTLESRQGCRKISAIRRSTVDGASVVSGRTRLVLLCLPRVGYYL